MAIELDNSFTIPVPPKQAWDVLLDVERIAPCMPGATVTEVNGEEITGTVKVKLGPVSLTYKGVAKFTERDETARSVSVAANGRETRGAGTASATVKASLAPGEDENQTVVTMHTSLNVTGRPAQFGRGVMADVSAKLVDQFAANLAELLASGNGAAAEATPQAAPEATAETATAELLAADAAVAETPAATAATPVPVAHSAPQRQESLNIVRLAAGPILKRVIPVAAVAGAGAFLYRRLRNLFRRSSSLRPARLDGCWPAGSGCGDHSQGDGGGVGAGFRRRWHVEPPSDGVGADSDGDRAEAGGGTGVVDGDGGR
jgi:carbon monoxide dehydrogenase subunit G